MGGRGATDPIAVNAAPVVSNSSPLIALAQIDLLDIVRELYPSVLIPPTVRGEIEQTVRIPTWVIERGLNRPIDPRIRTTLDPGEREAISLALEMSASWVILDDRAARSTARSLGLRVVGTLGVLLRAKDRDLLLVIRPHVDALLRTGFFVGGDLYAEVLAQAGES